MTNETKIKILKILDSKECNSDKLEDICTLIDCEVRDALISCHQFGELFEAVGLSINSFTQGTLPKQPTKTKPDNNENYTQSNDFGERLLNEDQNRGNRYE